MANKTGYSTSTGNNVKVTATQKSDGGKSTITGSLPKNSNIKINQTGDGNKKIAIKIPSNGKVTIKTNQGQNTKIKIKVRRRTRIVRRA